MLIKRDNIGGWDGDSRSTHCASMRTLNTQVKKTGMRQTLIEALPLLPVLGLYEFQGSQNYIVRPYRDRCGCMDVCHLSSIGNRRIPEA